MSLYLKILLVIFGLAYLISPVDIIPDLLVPYIGWLDDGVILATIVYLIRHNRLPKFSFFQQKSQNASAKSSGHRQTTHNQAKQDTDSTSQKSRTPYEILGIKPGASKKQIQTAYKEGIKKYHPDKLSHLGEEFSTLANEKFLEIQQAYDTLMALHDRTDQ